MAIRNARIPVVFLDKDGTLVEDVPYNVDPALVRFVPGAGEALRMLAAAGFALIVVSNQSGVARGLFYVRALDGLRDAFSELLSFEQVYLSGWYCCPHHPDGAVEQFAVICECRKPAPGLL